MDNKFVNTDLIGLTNSQQFKKVIIERELNEFQFFKHKIQLDETIDQYEILTFQNDDNTTSVWHCWDEENCNSYHKLNEVYSSKMKSIEVIQTLNNLIKFIRKSR